MRRSVGDQIDVRLNAEVEGYGNGRAAGLARGWREWWNEPLTWPVVVGLSVVAVVVLVARRRDLASTWRTRALLAAPALIPIVWHLVLKNHTLTHGWFTYRSFAVGYGAILLACTARIAADSRPTHAFRGRIVPESGTDLPQNVAADDVGAAGEVGQANVGLGASGSMP